MPETPPRAAVNANESTHYPAGDSSTAPQPGEPVRPGACRPGSGALPEHLGRYRLLRLLGKGGMGVVYLAEDSLLGRKVALKVPHRLADDAAALERFYREARSAARLQHPNICPVFDISEVEGHHLLTMAYIEGEPLSAHVAAYARQSPKEAATVTRTLALALQEAHGQGIIHRDLKPANIMIDRRGEPIVMDFGLAREVRTDSTNSTLPGTVVGTPLYMPPEQVRGDVAAIGPGSDIYALGVVLYELLTGRPPFRGNIMDVLTQHLRDQPAPPSSVRPEVGPCLDAICLKAMAKEPSQRFLSMADFAQALEDFLHDTSAAPTCVLDTPDAVSQAATEALVLLRTWGWEVGIEKVRGQLEARSASDPEPRLGLLLRWLQGNEAAASEAGTALAELRPFALLEAWALLARIFLANREHDFRRVQELLRQEPAAAAVSDNILRASFAHQRGFYHYHQGSLDAALAALHDALDLCGPEHFLTAQVLDTLGLVYERKNNLPAARELFERSVAAKQVFGDHRGVARSLRHLGALHLDWDDLESARGFFQRALETSLKAQDEYSQAQDFHYLGRVALGLGQREAAVGRKAAARNLWTEAARWLEGSIRTNQAQHQTVQLAYSLRDLGLVRMEQGDPAQAEQLIKQAEEVYRQEKLTEGLIRTYFAHGLLARRQCQLEEAERLLRSALDHFDQTHQEIRAARVQLEIARTLADAERIPQLVVTAYLDALKRAEACRHARLVGQIEEELKAIDEGAHWQHVFHRVRGRGASGDTVSLADGVSEVASALFLNLKEFISFCQGKDAGEVMSTLNQLLADLAGVLERHRGHVVSNLGGGFLALVRGPGHAERSLRAALDLIDVVGQFNRPRSVLGLPRMPVSVAVASGTLLLGNVGSYFKMDFTAVGAPVHLAARLVREADSRWPCISQETYELVHDRFEFAPGNPRLVDLRGLGRREVWDVVGLKKGSGRS